MIYRVLLQGRRAQRFALDYRLNDLPVTQRFVQVTREAQAAGATPQGMYFSTRLTERQFRYRLAAMRTLVLRVHDTGVWPMPDYRLTPATVTQAQLNHLHRLFHAFEEQSRLPLHACSPAQADWMRRDPLAYERVRADLNRLNIQIHHVEHAMKSREDWSWQFFGFHLSPQQHLPLHDDDCAAMTAQVKFGDLLLCYGTAGKNLYTCFLDDDIEVVQRGEVRQQVTVSSGVLAAFTTAQAYATSAAYERRQYERYFEWCDRNDVQRHGHDPRAPRYRIGNLVLGELADPQLGWDEVAEMLRCCDRVVGVEWLTGTASRRPTARPAAAPEHEAQTA